MSGDAEPENKEIKYFGYGANSSWEMMEAIIGRRPEGFLAVIGGYELFVQRWEEIPEDVRSILSQSWTPEFRSYAIRQKPGGRLRVPTTRGFVWSLTRHEKELVENWEICPLWYSLAMVTAQGYNRQTVEAETEIINNPLIGEAVDGMNYPEFLNDKKAMLELATKDRQAYLRQRSHE